MHAHFNQHLVLRIQPEHTLLFPCKPFHIALLNQWISRRDKTPFLSSQRRLGPNDVTMAALLRQWGPTCPKRPVEMRPDMVNRRMFARQPSDRKLSTVCVLRDMPLPRYIIVLAVRLIFRPWARHGDEVIFY